MRRLRGWIVFGLLAAVVGTLWYRTRDVPMTEAEIRAAIPTDVRYVPPTKREAAAEKELWALERDVYTDPNLAGQWLQADFDTAWPKYWHVAQNSDWVVPRVEALAKLGLPAAEADLNISERREWLPWNLYRVLALRCDLKVARDPKADIRRDVIALARLIRLTTLRRGSHGDQGGHVYFALEAINRALSTGNLDPATLKALRRVLPDDAEIVAVHQDHVRYELEEQVVTRIMPNRVIALLRPRLMKDDYRQFIVGRLDLPAALREQVDAAKGAMAMMATDKRDPRVSHVIRQRQDIMDVLPWKKPGEIDSAHRLRVLTYKLRLLAHPNPRSVLIHLGRFGFSPDENERNRRAWFALTQARLHLTLGEKGPLPRDPYMGKRLRYEPKRGIVWSIGSNRKDDGGTMDRFWIGKPDMVIQFR